jgi:hypothetical protein
VDVLSEGGKQYKVEQFKLLVLTSIQDALYESRPVQLMLMLAPEHINSFQPISSRSQWIRGMEAKVRTSHATDIMKVAEEFLVVGAATSNNSEPSIDVKLESNSSGGNDIMQ